MKRYLAVSSVALSLLGCSVQASVQAKGSKQVASASGSETLAPRESTFDREAREEEMIANRGQATEPSAEPATPEPGQVASAPAAKSRGKKKARAARAKRESGAELAAAPEAADHDRGHGNDADRVDEDNPGKSKK